MCRGFDAGCSGRGVCVCFLHLGLDSRLARLGHGEGRVLLLGASPAREFVLFAALWLESSFCREPPGCVLGFSWQGRSSEAVQCYTKFNHKLLRKPTQASCRLAVDQAWVLGFQLSLQWGGFCIGYLLLRRVHLPTAILEPRTLGVRQMALSSSRR